MMKKRMWIFIICLRSVFLYAQEKKIEQLDLLIEKSNKTFSISLDSAYYYNQKAFILNEKIGNDFYKARLFFGFSKIFHQKGKTERAIHFAKCSIFFAKKTNNYKVLYKSYRLLGNINYELGEYNNAFKNYQLALSYIKNQRDDQLYVSIYYDLANLFISKKDTVSALNYYELNRKHALLSKDTLGVIGAYNNVANIEFTRNPKKAEKNYIKALELAEQSKNHIEQFNIRINQANLFLDEKDLRRNEKASYYLKKAEELLPLIEEKSVYFYLFFNYGGYYLNKKDNKKAIDYYKKAMQHYEYKKKIPMEQKLALFNAMFQAYDKEGNYEKAFEYQSQYYKLYDSLFSMEKEKNYNLLFTKFEVEKKNNQINLLGKQKELEKAKKTRLLFAVIITLIFLVFTLFFYRNRLKTQAKLNLKQQELNHTKGILEGQNEERNRLAKELHDSVAGSLVGINLMLAHENEKLKSVSVTYIQENIDRLYSEIREISHNLSSNFLQEKSFAQLVYYLKDSYNKKGIFNTEVILFPPDALETASYSLKADLYRVLQELFVNIQRHANAKKVFLNITQNDNDVSIILEDDGVGFPHNTKDGIGIKNIRERLKIYNASFEIESNENTGTTILISLNYEIT